MSLVAVVVLDGFGVMIISKEDFWFDFVGWDESGTFCVPFPSHKVVQTLM